MAKKTTPTNIPAPPAAASQPPVKAKAITPAKPAAKAPAAPKAAAAPVAPAPVRATPAAAAKPAAATKPAPVAPPAAAPIAKAPSKNGTAKSVPTTDDIALRAYFIAEERNRLGRPGSEQQDWVEAERQLAAERTAKPAARKR